MQFIEGQIEKVIQQFQPDILIFACIIRLFDDLFEIQLFNAYLDCRLISKIIQKTLSNFGIFFAIKCLLQVASIKVQSRGSSNL